VRAEIWPKVAQRCRVEAPEGPGTDALQACTASAGTAEGKIPYRKVAIPNT